MNSKGNYFAVSSVGVFLFLANAHGDIIEREFVQEGSGKVASGTVLQGSKNMRDLGKRKSSRSSIRVLSPIGAVPGFPVTKTTEPAPEPVPAAPKPRFGYGAEKPSDGRTPVENPAPQPEAKVSAPYQPTAVYQFRYSYPVHREYYYGSPFFGYSPFSYGCSGPRFFHHGPRNFSFRSQSLTGGLSFFFGW
jgi:hypothetical protein